jgi:hypothetical protein
MLIGPYYLPGLSANIAERTDKCLHECLHLSSFKSIVYSVTVYLQNESPNIIQIALKLLPGGEKCRKDTLSDLALHLNDVD